MFERERWAETPDTECGTWNAVFWIGTGAACGVVVGLVAWKWFGR